MLRARTTAAAATRISRCLMVAPTDLGGAYLRGAAGEDLSRQMLSGLVLLRRDLCWVGFAALELDPKLAQKVLALRSDAREARQKALALAGATTDGNERYALLSLAKEALEAQGKLPGLRFRRTYTGEVIDLAALPPPVRHQDGGRAGTRGGDEGCGRGSRHPRVGWTSSGVVGRARGRQDMTSQPLIRAVSGPRSAGHCPGRVRG